MIGFFLFTTLRTITDNMNLVYISLDNSVVSVWEPSLGVLLFICFISNPSLKWQNINCHFIFLNVFFFIINITVTNGDLAIEYSVVSSGIQENVS